jgi:hypothetical protein
MVSFLSLLTRAAQATGPSRDGQGVFVVVGSLASPPGAAGGVRG